eukprot:2280824-Rhodomonas_salina.3
MRRALSPATAPQASKETGPHAPTWTNAATTRILAIRYCLLVDTLLVAFSCFGCLCVQLSRSILQLSKVCTLGVRGGCSKPPAPTRMAAFCVNAATVSKETGSNASTWTNVPSRRILAA